MRLARILGYLLLSLGVVQAEPITLVPGSLLVQGPNLISPQTGTIIEYTTAGTVIQNDAISGTGDIPESLTILNGNLYVSDGAGHVNLMNLNTGGVTSYFDTGMFGLNGLSNLGGNLLAMHFLDTAVSVYSTDGVLQNTIPLSFLPTNYDWNGIATNGSVLYIADYTSGNLYEYSLTGSLLGSISTGIQMGLTGVTYDPLNDSLWVNDNGTDQVLDFSTTGSLLSEFSTGGFNNGSGIAFVPANVPEPGYAGLLFSVLAMAAMVGTRQRAKRSAS